MDQKQKQATQIFGLAGALVAAMLLFRKKPGTATTAAVTIAILDESGNEIPHNSAVDLEGGGSYTVNVTVTNQSTLQGQPTPANLILSIGAMVVGLPPLISDTRTDSYGAGETLTFTYPLQVPNTECTGEIRAIILHPDYPDNGELASASLDFNVVAVKLPPCGDYGDVDGDGYVTAADAQLVADYVIGLIELTADQLHRADVNGDGQVNGVDALAISQYVEGVIDTFPVCVAPVYAASVDIGVVS